MSRKERLGYEVKVERRWIGDASGEGTLCRVAVRVPNRETRRLCRQIAGTPSNCPVVLVDGAGIPVERGEGWHYTNRSGDVVQHPGAYARKGWSSLVYRHSTLRCEVGREWLAAVVQAPTWAIETFNRDCLVRCRAAGA
jgi:hypothetical protein